MICYCENCGHKLLLLDRYCENCGSENIEFTKIVQNKVLIFNSTEWQENWDNATKGHAAEDIGIILINHNCFDETQEFFRVLNEYISYKQNQNIFYHILNLADQCVNTTNNASCEAVVDILVKISKIFKPKYLLIVGDRTLIGSIKWDNPAFAPGDTPDRFVDSDLPYVVLDTTELNKGQRWEDYDFTASLRVGRILCREDDTQDACKYLMNVMQEKCSYLENDMIGISTESWQRLSQSIVNRVSNGSEYYISPPLNIVDSSQLYEQILPTDLFYFNLHGSNKQVENYGYCWFGENSERSKFPIAYTTSSLPQYRGYIVGCEACYGAIPYDSNSILSNALRNGCYAFLGSHQVAWGKDEPPLSCADKIVEDFLLNVSKGYTVGDAYVMSLDNFTDSVMNPCELTTMAEFALYGDPSLRIRSRNTCVGKTMFEKPNMSFSSKIQVPMIDVRSAVALKIVKINKALEKTLQNFVSDKFTDYALSSPTIYKVGETNQYQATYAKHTKWFSTYMNIYFNEKGDILKVYHSK